MRITQWGEYGVHFVVFLARKARQGAEMVSAGEIAAAQDVPLNYTQQILHRLRDGGVIESIRGPRGGYRLARSSSQTTLYDILLAAEGSTLEIICESKPLSENRCSPGTACSLRPVWYGLRAHVDDYLRRLTVDDLESQLAAGAERRDRTAEGEHSERPLHSAGSPQSMPGSAVVADAGRPVQIGRRFASSLRKGDSVPADLESVEPS